MIFIRSLFVPLADYTTVQAVDSSHSQMPILGHRMETSLKLRAVELMWVLTPSPCIMMKIWTLLSSDLLGVGSRIWSETDWDGCCCVCPSLSYGLRITSLQNSKCVEGHCKGCLLPNYSKRAVGRSIASPPSIKTVHVVEYELPTVRKTKRINMKTYNIELVAVGHAPMSLLVTPPVIDPVNS